MQRVMGILVLLGLVAGWAAPAAAEEGKIRTLVITGDDAAPSHNWKEIAASTRQVLDADGRFDVRVSEDPLILESQTALGQYDVIVFLIYNKVVPTITPAAQQNLLDFVRSGKGFYVQHLASASFPEWSEFGKLCGRYWRMKTSGHGPRSIFTANVVDRQHPITKGMEDFQTDDELYAKLLGDAPIQVLVSAHSDWSGKTEPLVFTQSYGQGRVVYNAFGHDAKALATPAVQQLIARGVEFAAKGSVSEAK